MDTPYTHVLLDDDSGEPIGVVRDIDALSDGKQFGIIRRFDSDAPETYVWLHGLLLLPLKDAAPQVRNHVSWALTQPQPV